MADDPFDLQRFVRAQAPVAASVRQELTHGRKQSHWMWFVFPQLRGLGQSAMAQLYGIGTLDEAAAYLEHPTLGPFLVECTGLVLRCDEPSAEAIFGGVDAMKFQSSMTLFHLARPAAAEFRAALDRFYGGSGDAATLQRLGCAADGRGLAGS